MSDHEIVMFDSPEAARPHTIHGWLSRDGRFYDDERTARYAGCTHQPCDDCGAPTPKMYVKCGECRAKEAAARWEAMPSAPWDGTQMVYSEALNCFYPGPDEAEDMEDCENIADLRLVLCDPHYVPSLDLDHFADELPDDGEAADELLEAIDVFNAATSGIVLSWWPGKTRLRIEATDA